MEWIEYILGAVIILVVFDVFNNWRLGSKLSGKTSDEINDQIERVLSKLSNKTTEQIAQNTVISGKITVGLEELNEKLKNLNGSIDEILKVFNSRSSSAAKAMALYVLYEEAKSGENEAIANFYHNIKEIPEDLKDLKEFGETLKEKLENLKK